MSSTLISSWIGLISKLNKFKTGSMMRIGLMPLIRVNLYSMLGRKRFMKAILRYKCSRKGTFQTNLTGGKKKGW